MQALTLRSFKALPSSSPRTCAASFAAIRSKLVRSKGGKGSRVACDGGGAGSVGRRSWSGKLDEAHDTAEAVLDREKSLDIPRALTYAVQILKGVEHAHEAQILHRDLRPEIVRIGERIKAAAREQLPVEHPENPEIRDITIGQLSGFIYMFTLLIGYRIAEIKEIYSKVDYSFFPGH